MIRDFELKAGAGGFFTAEGGRNFRCLVFSRGKKGFSLSYFRRQGACLFGDAGAVEFDVLQLYEVFNVCLHPCQEVYGIRRTYRKWARSGGVWFRAYFWLVSGT